MDIAKYEELFTKHRILCWKYNYSTESQYQNRESFFSTLTLSKDGDELLLFNYKPKYYKDLEAEERNRKKAKSFTPIVQELNSGKYRQSKDREILNVSLEELRILGLCDNIQYTKVKSASSSRLEDIQAMIYGP